MPEKWLLWRGVGHAITSFNHDRETNKPQIKTICGQGWNIGEVVADRPAKVCRNCRIRLEEISPS